MSEWKESANHRRQIRDGVVEPRQLGGKNKRDRPWIVLYRWRESEGSFFFGNGKWRKMGAYRTQDEAKRAAQNQERKHSFYETRIEGPNKLCTKNL